MSYKREFDVMVNYLKNLVSYTTNIPFVKPDRVNFDITNRCPLQCVMCNICRRKHNIDDELTLEELKNIIGQIDEWGIKYLSFAGGETLIRKDDVLELIKYSSDKGIFTALITNGYFYDEKFFGKLMKSGIGKIVISIDGVDKKTHDKVRGKGSFAKAMKTVRYLSKSRKKKTPELEFATCVMSYNYDQLVDIYELMKSVGFDFISYQAVVPDNDYKNFSKSAYDVDFWPKNKHIDELEPIARKLIELKTKEGRIRNSKNYFRLMPRYFREKSNFNPGRCMAGYRIINIDPYGKINICGLGPNLSVRKSSLKELWTHKNYTRTRKAIKNCKVPCLMLCYEKLDLMSLYEAWKDKRMGDARPKK